jgi:peptide/nickel transport system substrate-binding protein
VRRSAVLIAVGLWVSLASCARPVPVSENYSISVPYDLDSLDPGVRNRLSDFSLLSNLYEPLVATDADLSAHPALAVRWRNPDALTWVFELRPGVRFHDGRPLTAEDVVWTFERLRSNPRLEMSGHVSSFRSIRALDAKTVEIRTVAPVGILLNKLRFILIVRRGEDTGTLGVKVNGTGPFRLSSWEKGRSLSLERNTAYWGPTPALGRVRFFLNRTADAALGDFLSGRSQFIQSSAKSTEGALDREPGVRLHRNSSVSVKFLYFNVAGTDASDLTGGPNPFRDVRVRRAVSLAIDRPELVRRLSVPAVPANQLVPPYIFGYDPSQKVARYAPVEARRLLAEAGWPDGFELTFPARGLFSEAAGLVADMLGRVGIRARVVSLPEAEWFAAMDGRRFSMTLTRFGCPTGDASDLLDSLIRTCDPQRAAGLANYPGYSNPDVDALITRAGRTLEMSQRQEMLIAATQRVMEDLPIVPLYVDQDVYAFRPGVTWKPRNDNFLIASEISRTP